MGIGPHELRNATKSRGGIPNFWVHSRVKFLLNPAGRMRPFGYNPKLCYDGSQTPSLRDDLHMGMLEQHKDESRFAGHKKLWKEWLGGNEITKRLLLALSFWVILTCFLHFKEVRMEVLEVGTSAPHYVISQIDFNFLDEEASQMIKQEAVRDIGIIYRVDESLVRSFRHGLENSLIENQKWRQDLKRTTFEEVYQLLDQIEEQIIQARFTDDRTLRRMNRLQLPVRDFFSLSVSASKTEDLMLPSVFWEEIESNLDASDTHHKETVRFLIAPFSKHLWMMQEDFSLERGIRKKVQNQIPDRYTHVDAGTQVIKKGEKVTSRHLAMMLAMKAALSKAQHSWTILGFLGNLILSFSLLLISLLYLYYFHRDFLQISPEDDAPIDHHYCGISLCQRGRAPLAL